MMNRTLIKILSWSEISTGVLGLGFAAWLAISTRGFSPELDVHGLVRYGAIILGVFGILTIGAGLVLKAGKYGPLLSGLLFVGAVVFAYMGLFQ